MTGHCPVHADADADEAYAWACPVECEHLLDELERRIDEVRKGNFVRMTNRDGVLYRQSFRDHQPIEEPVEWGRL